MVPKQKLCFSVNLCCKLNEYCVDEQGKYSVQLKWRVLRSFKKNNFVPTIKRIILLQAFETLRLLCRQIKGRDKAKPVSFVYVVESLKSALSSNCVKVFGEEANRYLFHHCRARLGTSNLLLLKPNWNFRLDFRKRASPEQLFETFFDKSGISWHQSFLYVLIFALKSFKIWVWFYRSALSRNYIFDLR